MYRCEMMGTPTVYQQLSIFVINDVTEMTMHMVTCDHKY